jgi:tRNA(Arg) A34 adenosine deaminase TadA
LWLTFIAGKKLSAAIERPAQTWPSPHGPIPQRARSAVRPVQGSEMDPAELMQLAIEKCHEGIAAGQSPFGCAIARGGRLLAATHNAVVQGTDITAHAEIVALRQACQAVGDIFLDGAIVASTCEPCPMCMAALHWARVDTVYYGATIAEAARAGFNELHLSAAELVRLGGSPVQLVPGVLSDECRGLFDVWLAKPNRQPY